MTFAIIRSEREITPRQRAKLNEFGGRPYGYTQGSHIDDLAALGKAIWLCPDHSRKFNARPYGYGTDPKLPEVRGWCDGCGEFHPACILFVKRQQ